MRVIEIKVFKFNELSKEAQEEVINTIREEENYLDYNWYESTKEDFHEFLETLGFQNIKSQFNGFYSQGDGASFDFTGIDFNTLKNYRPNEDKPNYEEIFDNWLDYGNKKLIRNAARLNDSLNVCTNKNSYATHYCHENTRFVSASLEWLATNHTLIEALTEEIEVEFTDLMRALSREYYKMLQTDYEYLMSDEAIKEYIINNEYEFESDGTIYWNTL